jgi:transposase InsO family protein
MALSLCRKALEEWAYRRGVKLDFIRPGKPTENGYIESFNGRLRDEHLNIEQFWSIEDAAQKLDAWAYGRAVQLAFIRPGKPVENAYIESFNGRFRDECLNEHWFVTMAQARQVIENWRVEYNEERPHSSLGYRTPSRFAADIGKRSEEGVSLTADSNLGRD